MRRQSEHERVDQRRLVGGRRRGRCRGVRRLGAQLREQLVVRRSVALQIGGHKHGSVSALIPYASRPVLQSDEGDALISRWREPSPPAWPDEVEGSVRRTSSSASRSAFSTKRPNISPFQPSAAPAPSRPPDEVPTVALALPLSALAKPVLVRPSGSRYRTSDTLFARRGAGAARSVGGSPGEAAAWRERFIGRSDDDR